MLYFAYGSNMLTTRLAARCPGARAVARGALPGHGVALEKRGRDGTGKATLLARAGARAEGVLFEVPAAEHAALDRAEGAGRGYDRVTGLAVETAAGTVAAFSYRAPAPVAGLPVFGWYLDLCLAGAIEHGLPERVVAYYRAHPRAPDPRPLRPARRAALAALARHAAPG